MRKEPASRLLQLARLFAAEPAGIGLDEIAAKFAVSRRTTARADVPADGSDLGHAQRANCDQKNLKGIFWSPPEAFD
jgi:hypothetical protein